MANQRQMQEIPSDMPIITLGNKRAEHTITMLSNPLCTPCAQMHVRIERMLEENENLKCQIIFLSNTDENNAGGKFVRKLFSLPDKFVPTALHRWFIINDKNFEKWNEGFQAIDTQEETQKIQDYHNFWANMAEIKGTPTFFYNNRLLPEMVELEDLPLLTAKISSFHN